MQTCSIKEEVQYIAATVQYLYERFDRCQFLLVSTALGIRVGQSGCDASDDVTIADYAQDHDRQGKASLKQNKYIQQ